MQNTKTTNITVTGTPIYEKNKINPKKKKSKNKINV
jgi:hypothetical protein